MDSTRIIHSPRKLLARRLRRYVATGGGSQAARRCDLDVSTIKDAYWDKVSACMKTYDLGPDLGSGGVKHDSYLSVCMGLSAYELLREAGFTEEEAFAAYDYMTAPMRKIARTLYRFVEYLPGSFGILRRGIISDLTGARRLCWSTKLVRNDDEVLEYQITRCLYHEVCEAHGHPEFTRAFCRNDEFTYGSFGRRIKFERLSSFGAGDGCCHDRFTVM